MIDWLLANDSHNLCAIVMLSIFPFMGLLAFLFPIPPHVEDE